MNKLIIPLVVLLAAGCKEKFVSPAPPVASGYLVMEGIVNNGGGVTNIRLSRTSSLKDSIRKHENQAIVKIEGSDNSSISLSENAPGNYTISNLHLDPAVKYRLSIKTGNNEQYLSDFVTVIPNPPIDSISWVSENDGVHVFINTHNPQNNTLYYQWEYDETWEFHSAYKAALKYETAPPPNTFINIGVTYREPSDPQIYTCWQFNSSSTILLGSSAKLSRDIIHLPITKIPAASWKLSVLYSIFVKQYAWSKEGFEFLERMKKNTEAVGSVFDPQPSELNSNIQCTSNPSLQSIGFFNICTIHEKRIFIKNSEVPGWGFKHACRLDIVENNRDSIQAKAIGKLPVYADKLGQRGEILTFTAATENCVDCRLTGTNVKPIYWP